MKKQNGFIATSLLYTFFLAFVTLFIGVVTLHLQNRVYLNKLEDSSKNAIYLRQMKERKEELTPMGATVKVQIDIENVTYLAEINEITNNLVDISYIESGITKTKQCNFAKCETIYYDSQVKDEHGNFKSEYADILIEGEDDGIYILQGCEC